MANVNEGLYTTSGTLWVFYRQSSIQCSALLWCSKFSEHDKQADENETALSVRHPETGEDREKE